MIKILAGSSLLLLLLLLSFLFTQRGLCLIVKASELELYTKFNTLGLVNFFSVLSLSKTNCDAISIVLKSEKFDFSRYYIASGTLERLKFINENYNDIEMRYMVKVDRLQKSEYGRRWLVENLDKLKNSDISVYLIKADLFTLYEQERILIFAMEHQRPFMWNRDFCSVFSDLSIFDHELLWPYLDPLCFDALSEELGSQAIRILQKRAEKDANPTAILFLMLVGVDIAWEGVDFGQSELKNLLQEYQKAYLEKDHCKSWELYKLLVPHFENLSQKKYLIALPQAWMLIANYSTHHAELQHHKEITNFMKEYDPSNLNCYLVKEFCKRLFESNTHKGLELFKLPTNWRDELLKNYSSFIPPCQLPFKLRLGEWRKIVMRLTVNKSLDAGNRNYVYSNNRIGGKLLVDHYIEKINELVRSKLVSFDPNLKIDCSNIKYNGCHLFSTVWIGRIYQMAIYGKELPPLHEEFKKAIFRNESIFCNKTHEKLIEAICLNPNDSPSAPAIIESAINLARLFLEKFNISFYYESRDDCTIF